MDKWEIVKARCSKCGKIKNLSFFKGDIHRYTWCIDCAEVVEWSKVEDEEDEE